jgi:uncharacterized protein YegJ (DUF2314 family)
MVTVPRVAMPAVLALSLACGGAQPASDVAKPAETVAKTTISVAETDREMNAAMQQARDKVAVFVARLEKAQTTDRNFSVKIPLREGEQVEHFWLVDVRHDKGVFRGTLGNDPELIHGHKYGEPVSVPIKEISDWMFVDHDSLVGGFTIRVLRNRMNPADRAEMDKSLDFKIQ